MGTESNTKRTLDAGKNGAWGKGAERASLGAHCCQRYDQEGRSERSMA